MPSITLEAECRQCCGIWATTPGATCFVCGRRLPMRERPVNAPKPRLSLACQHPLHVLALFCAPRQRDMGAPAPISM